MSLFLNFSNYGKLPNFTQNITHFQMMHHGAYTHPQVCKGQFLILRQNVTFTFMAGQ